jgi:hypothetical protein
MNLAQIQTNYAEYTQLYEAQQITKDEYLNLLQGLEVEKAVTSTAEELQFKEQLNIAINAAINIVSIAAA